MSERKRLVLDKLIPAGDIIKRVETEEIDELVLANLGITDETFPVEICSLTQLTSLDLSGNELSKLPNIICKLTLLEHLNISNNELYSLPRDWWRFKNLKTVAMEGNKFAPELDAIIKCWLARSESLNLAGRELRYLCPEIRICSEHLRELILDDNNLSSLPEEVGLLLQLERISIQRNQLVALDWEITQCVKLVSLDMTANKIRRLATETSNLTNLVELFLSNNDLGTVPPVIFSLNTLETLTLSKNGIQSIPSLIFNLQRLKEIDLSHNEIDTIPREICMLPKLTKLNLHTNKVVEIPIFINELGSLEELDLSNNELSYIYNDLGALANLTTLKVGSNKLAEVSSTVGLLPSLKKLILKGNDRLRSPAPEIVKQGTSKVLEALSKSAGKRFIRDDFMRLIVLGDSGVGKSSLLHCLRTQNPDSPLAKTGKAALVMDDWTLVIVDEKTQAETVIKFETWDVSTPVEMMEATRIFFSSRTIFVVACKITNTDVWHWINLIKSKVSDPSIFVVATHCDSSSSDEAVKLLSNRYSGDVVNTFGISCKKGTNIQRLIAGITKHTMQHRYFVSAHIPAKYRALDTRIASFKFPFITVAELDKHLEDCQIMKPAQLLRAQRYLQQHAKLLSHPDAIGKDVLVCNMGWFFDALMKLYQLGKPVVEKDELNKLFGDERKKMIKALRQLYLAAELNHSSLFLPALVPEAERTTRLERTQLKVAEWRLDAVMRNIYIFREPIKPGFFRQFAMRLYAHAYVEGFDGYDEFFVSKNDGAPIVGLVSHPNETDIEILFQWHGGSGSKKPAFEEIQFLVKDLVDMIYKHFSDTCYDWLVYPVSFSLDDVPIRGDGSGSNHGFSSTIMLGGASPAIMASPAISIASAAKKRTKINLSLRSNKSLDDSGDSDTSSKNSPRRSNDRDQLTPSSSDSPQNSANAAAASVVSSTPSQQLMAPTGVAFTSKEMHLEDARRKYHYRYFRNETRYLLVNPGLELPHFEKSSLGSVRPVYPELGDHVHRTVYLKRPVVVSSLEVDSRDFVSACSEPSHGLIQLQHKNVIVPIAVDLEELAVMMPDISDINLATLIRTDPNELSRNNYLKIMIDIGEGLAVLHSAKPAISAQNVSSYNVWVRKTSANTYKAAVASFGVLSPRSNNLVQHTRESNIFAFGIIMAEILSKTVIVDPAASGVEVPALPSNTPSQLVALIEKCTSPKYADSRPQIEDALRELYKLAVVTSSQLRSAVQAELEYASTHLIVSRIGVVPLVRFLQDKALRDHFYEFLCKEYSQENLLFIEQVHEYKKQRTKKRAYIATQMYKELFPKINLSDQLMTPLTKKITAGEFPPELFDQAERDIIMLMESDTYKRYLAQRAKK